MRKLTYFGYHIKQGFINLKRHFGKSMMSIAIMTVCIFLFGLFYFVFTNISHIIKDAETNVGVSVFFDEDVTEQQIQDIGAKINTRSEVAYIKFISADEAWEKYKRERLAADESSALVESFGDDNPLEGSDSYEVHLADVSKQTELVKYIEGLEGVRNVNDLTQVAEVLSNVNRIIRVVSMAFTAILIIISVFIISSTIGMGIGARKTEISIMKLIGAKDGFIRAPFMVEGIVLGLVGAIVPSVLLKLSYDKVTEYFVKHFSNGLGSSFELMEAGDIFGILIPICFAIGLGIGIIGSFIALNRQLAKIN